MERLIALCLLLLSLSARAQNAAPDWLESNLHANGKMNVVILVIAVIILGLGAWMWRMDRKLGKLEARQKK
jgi:hypothetical protein